MFVIVMGVSGSGKTTIGRLLANQMDCRFYEGDDFHPPANVAKMSAGIPLTDEDRAGWLAALAELIQTGLNHEECGVIACSALKEKYRHMLAVDPGKVKFVYLKGSFEVVLPRLQKRRGHFMKPGLLHSQFTALEEPSTALVFDIRQSPEGIVQKVMEQLWKT